MTWFFLIYKEYRVICEKGLCIVLRGLVAARNSMDEDSRRSNHLHIRASASSDRATLGLRASAKWHFSQKLWGECQRLEPLSLIRRVDQQPWTRNGIYFFSLPRRSSDSFGSRLQISLVVNMSDFELIEWFDKKSNKTALAYLSKPISPTDYTRQLLSCNQIQRTIQRAFPVLIISKYLLARQSCSC